MYYLGINTYGRYSVFTKALLSTDHYATAAEAIERFNSARVFNYATNANKHCRWILTKTELRDVNYGDTFTIIAKATSLSEFMPLYPELFI